MPKPLVELDHYETLEIPRDAARQDVERAYQLARATYASDSLAGHSVFEEGDAEVMRERVELAYRTLIDPEARAAYDEELARCDDGTSAGGTAEVRVPEAAPAPETAEPLDLAALESLAEIEAEDDDEGADYDGARLRRIRLRRGIELDEIAGATKVNPTYLDFIERERFDDLPAAVYVRGFVMGYAQCVGLEPARVARSYMQRYEERRESPRRGLFSRR